MIPKKFKLAAQQFPRKGYQQETTEHFTLKRASKRGEYGKIGVVVPLKIVDGSVGRNRVKRVIFGAIKNHYLQNKDDILIIMKKQPARGSLGDLAEEVRKIFSHRK